MGLTNRVRTIEILLYLTENKLARRTYTIISVANLISQNFARILRNDKTLEYRNGLYAHLFATHTHLIRRHLNDITIIIYHGHTIYIDFTLRRSDSIIFKYIGRCDNPLLFPTTIRHTAVREYSLFTILLSKLLILDLGVLYRRHDRSIGIHETNNFVVNNFTLTELTFKLLSHFKAEVIIFIKTAIVLAIQYNTTSTGYIIIFLILLAGAAQDLIQNSALHLLINRQIASSARSTMHLQSQFYNITALELTKIVSKLSGINMLIKSRSEISLSLLAARCAYANTTRNAARDILTTNLHSTKSSNLIANLQIRNRSPISNRSQRHQHTIRLLATQTDRLDIALIGIQITTGRITIFILTANQVIKSAILFG